MVILSISNFNQSEYLTLIPNIKNPLLKAAIFAYNIPIPIFVLARENDERLC
jgi:hypothetical protein